MPDATIFEGSSQAQRDRRVRSATCCYYVACPTEEAALNQADYARMEYRTIHYTLSTISVSAPASSPTTEL